MLSALLPSSLCTLLQVLVASPPLQHFFSMANTQLHQGPLGGAMQEVFDQIHAGSQYSSFKPDRHAYDWTLPFRVQLQPVQQSH